MNRIFLLSRANIRKSKGQTIILAVLLLISSMMLNIGLVVMLGFGSFFERTATELNTSDACFIIPETLYDDNVENLFRTHPEIQAFQKNKAISSLSVSFDWNGEPFGINTAFCDMDEPRALSGWKLVGDSLPVTPESVLVPYIYNVAGGYGLGDEIVYTLDGKPFRFVIAGFTESIYQDRMSAFGDIAYVTAERFAEMSDALTDARCTLVFVSGTTNSASVESDLMELTGITSVGNNAVDDANRLIGTDYASVKNARTSMPSMMSAMLIVFTMVVAVVCLLVIRSRIGNSIEEDMPKIGSLQSIGYTSRQITLSVVAQYGSIAVVACLLGVIPAYLSMPLVVEVFAQQSGLLWTPGFDPAISGAAVGSLSAIVVAVSLLAARKIRKIQPVQALRGGIQTHSFKKNRIQLEKSRFPLTLAMSLKSILNGVRQSMTVLVIVVVVSFTATIACILYYNSAVDLSSFEKLPGIERANAGLFFGAEEDPERVKIEVLAHEDVWKAQYLDSGKARVDGIDTGAMVMSDFSAKETVNVYDGVFPRYDNEIAIAGLLADTLGKNIGDEVSVGRDGLPYIITGLTQGMEAGNMTVYLTLDGMQRVTPGFKQSFLMVYLNKGTDAAVYITEAEAAFAGRLFSSYDGDAGFAEGVRPFAGIISSVGLAIVAIAGFVVILVLYFIIGAAIIHRRRELGIKKAIGYTTRNLMNQVALDFAIPLGIGAAAGCFLGAISMNLLMSVAMRQMGIMKASFIVPAPWVVATGCLIVALSYLASMLITWRIRKISAYSLVTEI